MMYTLDELLVRKGLACVLLKTFGDISGKCSNLGGYSSLVCHSGYTEKQWEPLESNWRTVCDRFGVSEPHTTDLMAHPRRGAYKGWDDKKQTPFSPNF